MKEYLRKSWHFWVCGILEILGQKLIGRNSSIYPFFTMGVVAIFELYILLKLPYSEKLWIHEESADNPKCTQIRWIGLIPILAVSFFSRTTLWYFIAYYETLERAVLYFAGTEEEKEKARKDVSDKITTAIIIAAVFIGVLIYYAHTISTEIKAKYPHHLESPSH